MSQDKAFDQWHKRFRHLDRNDARIAWDAGIMDERRRATVQPTAAEPVAEVTGWSRKGGGYDNDITWLDTDCLPVGTKLYTDPVAPADAVRDARNDFERGYFCAVSVALREDGPVTTVRSMFSQGGDANKADPFDIDLFIEHGLMTSTPKEPA